MCFSHKQLSKIILFLYSSAETCMGPFLFFGSLKELHIVIPLDIPTVNTHSK